MSDHYINELEAALTAKLKPLIAAKDREIAALREAMTEAHSLLGNGNLPTSYISKSNMDRAFYVLDAALVSPAPNPAEAMRAQCESLAWTTPGDAATITAIARRIEDLKGNGEGPVE